MQIWLKTEDTVPPRVGLPLVGVEGKNCGNSGEGEHYL